MKYRETYKQENQKKETEGYYAHESAYVDQPCEIGEETKIWHFCHIMKDSKIGKNCVLGQNVNISSGVVIGDNVKIQNNVSIYTSWASCETLLIIRYSLRGGETICDVSSARTAATIPKPKTKADIKSCKALLFAVSMIHPSLFTVKTTCSYVDVRRLRDI